MVYVSITWPVLPGQYVSTWCMHGQVILFKRSYVSLCVLVTCMCMCLLALALLYTILEKPNILKIVALIAIRYPNVTV
jgi:hypothetical protein